MFLHLPYQFPTKKFERSPVGILTREPMRSRLMHSQPRELHEEKCVMGACTLGDRALFKEV